MATPPTEEEEDFIRVKARRREGQLSAERTKQRAAQDDALTAYVLVGKHRLLGAEISSEFIPPSLLVVGVLRMDFVLLCSFL
jgi:hypothetical protein